MLWRHLQILVRIPHRRNEQALLRFPRNDARSTLASLQQPLATIQNKTAFDLFALAAVAFVAALRENWPDLLLEKLEILCARPLRGNRQHGDTNRSCASYSAISTPVE